jgi:hypothetical protein
MSPQRPSWRAAIAVVSAAALIAVGANTLSYAVGGPSLALGKANHTVTIENTGKGPALSLISKPKFPPLAVSNGKLVKNLNVDKVDGKDAQTLSPTTYRFSMGADGGSFTDYSYFKGTIPGGTYLVNMWGFISPSPGTGWQCLAIDYDRILASDPGGYYLLDVGEGQGIPKGSHVVEVEPGSEVLFGCASSGLVDMVIAPTFTFRKLNGVTDRPGAVFTPRPAQRKDLQGLR